MCENEMVVIVLVNVMEMISHDGHCVALVNLLMIICSLVLLSDRHIV